MWTGSLAFGLVNVPVKMYAATEDHSVRFHQVHLADGGRIKMQRICSACGAEVAYRDIGKGYEDPSGRTLVFGPTDLEDLPAGPTKEIEVLEFVPSEQVDPILFDRSYYLEPDGRALKPYVLLREALQRTERTAIVKVALRQRTQLAALRIHDDVLVLQTMLWPDEVRSPDFGFRSEDVAVRPQELQMAESLIANLSADFEPSQYTDAYREAILQLIDARLAGGEGRTAPQAGASGGGEGVLDLMDALKASVARTSKASAPAPRRPASAKGRPASAAASPAPAETATGRPAEKRSAAKRAAKTA